MSAAEGVREFLAAHAEDGFTGDGLDDVISTHRYHDGMGTGVAVLRAADLRAVLGELEQAQATVEHLRRLAAEAREYIGMQRDLLRRKAGLPKIVGRFGLDR
ncbi:MAG: hypothetical protein GEV09_19060 [Pseudonocardiaceae bacterium]|nr:hypothetical protein [Pseudonocardiaceae bacterium]